MTSNDAQMDVLLRRYAGKSQSGATTEHLDADELNAFAEGALPEAARTRYVSHLIDCDNCRQVVSQLAIASGTVLEPEATTAGEASGAGWWKKLSGFFSPMTLRYAAFALVLITVAGVVFLVTRRPAESNLVASSQRAKQAPDSAVKPYSDEPAQTSGASPNDGNNNKALTSQSPSSSTLSASDEGAKSDKDKTGNNPASPPKPAREGDVTSSPALVAKKAETGVTEITPSYAPPPPLAAERSELQREQPKTSGGTTASGPRKSEASDKFKAMDRVAPVGEFGKDNRTADDASLARNRTPAPASKRASDEKVSGPRRDLENNAAMNRNANEVRARNAQGIVTQSAPVEEKTPETRSAGGRKFRRQGNSWVDTKFKSSMTLKSVSRGSSEFNSLDSGLRALAQQLGGELLVVWKNKAYLIK